ncbi:MAG: hypothetical protein M3315_06275 [Actinomycetota bacterium]|nr:hypothetical protein [Actinomycetota bacterium]
MGQKFAAAGVLRPQFGQKKISSNGGECETLEVLPVATQGLLDYDELRAKLASLEETRKTAEHELAILKDHRKHIAELERDKEAVLEHYAAIAPEALDSLTPEERRHLYGMLRLRATQYPDGKVAVEMSSMPESILVLRKIPVLVLS